jgi:hypothetical protein
MKTMNVTIQYTRGKEVITDDLNNLVKNEGE